MEPTKQQVQAVRRSIGRRREAGESLDVSEIAQELELPAEVVRRICKRLGGSSRRRKEKQARMSAAEMYYRKRFASLALDHAAQGLTAIRTVGDIRSVFNVVDEAHQALTPFMQLRDPNVWITEEDA